MHSHRGFSVNVVLPSGGPDGIELNENASWTARGLVIPRAIFGEIRTRPELDRTGCYRLGSPGEAASLPSL